MKNRCGLFGMGIFFMIGFLIVGTFAAMLLWNYLMVPLFSAPVLNFWQTLGLMVLGRLLTGGFWKRGSSWRGPGGGMHKRWQSMSEEERKAFKERWERRRERD